MTVKFTYTGATFLIDGRWAISNTIQLCPTTKFPDPVKGIASMIGQSLQLTMSPTGRVLDVQGVEAMMDKMSKAIDIPDANLREAIQSQMKAQFNAESIKKMTKAVLPSILTSPWRVASRGPGCCSRQAWVVPVWQCKAPIR
jgi:hypothetical protein